MSLAELRRGTKNNGEDFFKNELSETYSADLPSNRAFIFCIYFFVITYLRR